MNSQDYIYGVISFFVIAIGGVAIGVLFAIIGSFITKWATSSLILLLVSHFNPTKQSGSPTMCPF